MSAVIDLAGSSLHRRPCAGELFSARAYHRLDELPIGVLIRAFDELGQMLSSVRGFVVRALDIIGTDRIVPRLDDIERIEMHAHRLETIAQRHSLCDAL